MRPVRKIALVVVSVVVLLVAVLAATPLFFGDRIAARLQAQIDQSVNAHVAWSGIGLSLLRDFPNVTASVNGLRVSGVKRFEVGAGFADAGPDRVVILADSCEEAK